MMNAENILYEFLVGSNFISNAEFEELTESSKMESLKEITKEVLSNILSRLSTVDTTPIDRSRGDIRQFSSLELIQEAIQTLISICRKYDLGTAKVEVPQSVFMSLETIVTAIKNLNNYSDSFKEAYRNKKTLLMLQYQSVIISIVTELSYIISSVIDVKDGKLDIRNRINYTQTNYYHSLKTFNDSVKDGSFNKTVSDVKLVREFFTEVSNEYTTTILEAGDIMSMIVDGIKGFYSSFDSNGRLTGLIYKAAGVIVLVLSLRGVFYTLYRCSNKIQDSLNNIKNFVNFKELPNNNTINKFISFNHKNSKDVENASNLASQEIKTENKELSTEIKQTPVLPINNTEVKEYKNTDNLENEFTIDF